MTKEEIQSQREEILAEILSIPYLKDIPYKLLHSEEVPITPLMRSFVYTFEFCRRRYIEESNFDNLVGYDFDNDKFLFLLRHNFGIEVKIHERRNEKNLRNNDRKIQVKVMNSKEARCLFCLFKMFLNFNRQKVLVFKLRTRVSKLKT